ncbi:unnamed protein product [Parajaminaea phylloscopi]
MSRLISQSQRLADQETNWRRPRSPALAIPGAREPSGGPKASKASTISAGSTSAGAWSHFKRANGAANDRRDTTDPSHTKPATPFGPASYDAHKSKDASSADNWRAHHILNREPSKGAQPGSLGSTYQHASLQNASLLGHHHRKHVGFNASSNAAEVARRAFVVSEIGSIGKLSASSLSSARSADGPGLRTASKFDFDRDAIQPAAPLRPLMVSGFADAASSLEDEEQRPMRRSLRNSKEDWAMTPTSSLPSLPTSPTGDRRQAIGKSLHLFGSDDTSGLMTDQHHKARTAMLDEAAGGTPHSRLPQMTESAAAHAAGVPSLTASIQRDDQSPSVLSPRRGEIIRSTDNAGNGDSHNVASAKLGAPSLTSPRRPTENLGKFRQSFESPTPDGHGARNSSPGMSGSLLPLRRQSAASLASAAPTSGAANGHHLAHSRRDSNASNFSSPSAASIVSLRPAYGVYRPPHLRNRSSANGLTLSVAHYDRVRTPSLRGSLRSPDVPSRPGSTQPQILVSSDSKIESPLPSRLNASVNANSGTDSPPGDGPSSDRDRSLAFQKLGARTGLIPGSLKEEPEEDEINLSHEEMMQVRTSLTDSYCFSRRSSMMSHFRVGNGVPVIDVFQVGDRLGPGMLHDGYPITIAQTSEGFDRQQRDVTGTRLEVVDKLGEGSYAVVYLVREVARDDQVHVGPKDEGTWSHEGGKPIGNRGGPPKDEDADATLADMTLSGGTLQGHRNVLPQHLDDESFGDDEPILSSTLRAEKPRHSFSVRVAAEEEQEKINDQTAEQAARDGRSQPFGIDEPHEGRLFALKCLCKRDLSDEMLDVQRLEATIHQSIPPHVNIVTLYRTYETPEWLFLVLEYCPGQDLFYWLEQAQDAADEPRPGAGSSGSSTPVSDHDGTPPSPSLLASTSGSGLLSRRRLRLISKMFRQMCEAVQFCHDRGISHRDIKPENFIVEDRRSQDRSAAQSDEDGQRDVELLSVAGSDPAKRRTSRGRVDRRVSTSSISTTRSNETTVTALAKTSHVVVKLTDFGLATAEQECQDFDCGSKPYMAYECRNNITSYYDPQQADIWSLGIVLLNLIFHRSPFREPSMERCESFAAYCYDPIGFLTESFEGLTVEMAEFLSQKVLCNVIPRPDASTGEATADPSQPLRPIKRRVSAREFAEWVRDLPRLMGLQPHEVRRVLKRGYSLDLTSPLAHSRAPSNSSTLPSMFASPRGLQSNLVVEEDDDGGYGQHPLFPEYAQSIQEAPDRAGDPPSMKSQGIHTDSRNLLQTPESLPSPSFSSPRRPMSRQSETGAAKGTASSNLALTLPSALSDAPASPTPGAQANGGPGDALVADAAAMSRPTDGDVAQQRQEAVASPGDAVPRRPQETSKMSSLSKMFENTRLSHLTGSR